MATMTDTTYPLDVMVEALEILARDYGLRAGGGTGQYVTDGVAVIYDAKHRDVEIVARVDQTPEVDPIRRRTMPPALHDLVTVQSKAWLDEAQDFLDHPPAAVYGGQRWTRYHHGEPRFPYDLLLDKGDRTLEWRRSDGRFFVVVVRDGQAVALVRDRTRSGFAE